MQLEKRFNEMTFEEYQLHISSHKTFKNFNTLGLFRSILENNMLNKSEKITIRDFANTFFQKTFEFLQLKDPETYVALQLLSVEYTVADETQLWNEVKQNQEKILKDKKIKHRNFGTYSKHLCGNDWCHLNGLMIHQGSFECYGRMHFKSDKNKNEAKNKSNRLKVESKIVKKDIKSRKVLD